MATLEPTKDAPVPADETSAENWWESLGATLTDPVELTRPELATAARAFENVLVSHFDSHDLSMPPLPGVAQRVLAELRQRDGSLQKVAHAIAEDQVMAAAVLRLANSPLYRGADKILALRPAVTRLGTRAMRTLMMHESLRETMFGHCGDNREMAELLWTRALASAHIMQALAPLVGANIEDAFLAGLLHDIGNVITLRIAHDNQAFARYGIDYDVFEYLCQECHQEFGELVADAWSLPADIKTLVSDHHSMPSADDPLRVMRLLLMLTDMATAVLGYCPEQPYDLVNARPAVELGLTDKPKYLALLRELPDRLGEALREG